MSNIDRDSTDERIILDLKKLGFHQVEVLGRYNYKQVQEGIKMHSHEGMLEICYMDNGYQCYSVEDKEYHLKGGSIFVTFPGEIHGTANFPEEKGSLYWLIIKLPKPGERLLNLTTAESEEITIRLKRLKDNRLFSGSKLIKHNLDTIFNQYYTDDSIFKKIVITNALLNFLLETISCGLSSREDSPCNSTVNICNYIENNICDELHLNTLADISNISLSHFKNRFKKDMGVSPADYILRKKIDKAKDLLPESHSICDVAYALSFSSSSYFATVFKRYTGVTPSQYITTRGCK